MEAQDSSPKTPAHIAVIPDGNRRWAKQQGVTTEEGHKKGYERLAELADLAFARGVNHLSAYSFSTENWSRSKDEIDYLMKLTAWVLSEEAQKFHQKGIKIRITGSRSGVSQELLENFEKVEKLTANNNKGNINICFNYGGRRDIVEAVNRVLESGVKSVDEESFPKWLSTDGIPDPDLIIRTSGEQRLSNYLPWESAYSELYFTGVLWPDFDEAELDKALSEYANRKRSFGK